MRFPEIFASRQGPVLSFEVFPPRTEHGMVALRRVLPRLVALRPSFMTVTYGAMGTTQERTVEIASLLRNTHGMETACHLTCVGATREAIEERLEAIRSAGIENIVALRGDPPAGERRFVPPAGGFAHANELVAHIRSRGGFGIAVAGYPEKHVEAPDLETDLRYLKQKVEAGADLVITQLFYQNADYFAFVERVRALGVAVPVVPGLLPIQSYGQVLRLASLCGATIPATLRERLDGVWENEAAVRRVGIRWTVSQCRELLERGVPGIHFYVLNRADHMEGVLSRLRREGWLE